MKQRSVMRRLVDTLVLVCLLVGPALVLTCVRQEASATPDPVSQQEEVVEDEDPYDVFVYTADTPRP